MLTDIRLQHFRSYEGAYFELDPGVNIIVGPNASGKTNLLEAVLVIARGSSYRVKDTELVQFDADWARLDATTMGEMRTVKLVRSGTGVSKSYEFDEQKLARLHPSRMLPVVLFEPNHLLLLSGSPDLRRTFLDDLLEQLDVHFGAMRKQYRRVLTQRNALLKKNPPNLKEQLFVWNLRLSELAGQIVKARVGLLQHFNASMSDLYSNLADRTYQVALEYATRFDVPAYETQLLHKLETSLDLEVMRGFTAYGPHRDDMAVLINGYPAQEAASRGEVRTLVLALKVFELQLLEDSRGQRPLLLLDDVFSELDSARRHALTSYLQVYQTFITTTDADVVAQHFAAANSIVLTR
ncbi:MAG TPA: DNA replication and repair protein RecF [Candidatus Saccharimonadales bacterium]|nr:DNA replication and repair protein RecF [Candidatus Saccharimonadales bacterium]